jgi:riboflavin transporter
MITGVALFAALALALNVSHIQVPFPPLPFLIFEFWEIPIVICMLIFGFYAALTASVINTFVLILINPGVLPSGPIYNLIAVAVTLLAVMAVHKASTRTRIGAVLAIAGATALAMVVRTSVMSVVNYTLLPLPPPLGIPIPDSAVVPLLPLIGLFNAIVVLYTVPIAYVIFRAVSKRLHFKLAYPLPLQGTKT